MENFIDYSDSRACSSTLTTPVCASTFKNFIDFRLLRVRVSTFRDRVCAHMGRATEKSRGWWALAFCFCGSGAGGSPWSGAARRRFLRSRRVNVTNSYICSRLEALYSVFIYGVVCLHSGGVKRLTGPLKCEIDGVPFLGTKKAPDLVQGIKKAGPRGAGPVY